MGTDNYQNEEVMNCLCVCVCVYIDTYICIQYINKDSN